MLSSRRPWRQLVMAAGRMEVTLVLSRILRDRDDSGEENPGEGHFFWQDALAWQGSITGRVLPRVLVFGIYAAGIALLHGWVRWRPIEISHIQYSGGFLALLLVLRTNAGYDRWWEARKLWGGIVNQSRNLAIKGVCYGPRDATWREAFVRWCAAFPHATRMSLRGVSSLPATERTDPALESLLGPKRSALVVAAQHMPSYVAAALSDLITEARRRGGLDGYAFLEVDRERALLIDHLGACERILRTPLPRVHSIKLRRFILLYMLGLPLAIASSSVWLSAMVSMLVAYPLFAIDQIGQELENPFSKQRESHLPLDRICDTIQGNLMALLTMASPIELSADVSDQAGPQPSK